MKKTLKYTISFIIIITIISVIIVNKNNILKIFYKDTYKEYVDYTNEYGFAVKDIVLNLTENNYLDYDSNVYITNDELFRQKLIPPIIQHLPVRRLQLTYLKEEYKNALNETIFENEINYAGANGDGRTYLGSMGGGYTRNMAYLQAYSIDYHPMYLNEDIEMIGSTNLIGRHSTGQLLIVQHSWKELSTTADKITVYEIEEGSSVLYWGSMQAYITCYLDEDEVLVYTYLDPTTYEKVDSHWWVPSNSSGPDKCVLENGEGKCLAFNPVEGAYVEVLDYGLKTTTLRTTAYWTDRIIQTNKYGYDADGNLYTGDGYSTIVEE